MATLLANAPSSNVDESDPELDIIRVRGRRGTRIVFSWTWNEKRKNDMEEARSAYGNNGSKGFDRIELDSSEFVDASVLEMPALYPLYTSPMTLGKKPAAVSNVDILTSAPRGNHKFHLRTTFEAHQKFATLSSNNPRANGNMRLIGWRMADVDAKGGRKGRKRARNDAAVTKAS